MSGGLMSPKKKMIAGSGGLLIVLPNRSWAGRWGIVEPKRPSGCGGTASRPPRQGLPPPLAPPRQNLRRPKPCPGQGAHLYHRKLEPPHPVLSGPPQAPDAQLQQVQRKPGRQHPVLHRQQMWRGTGTKNTINTYLAIPDFGLQHFHIALGFFGFEIAVVPKFAAHIHARQYGGNLFVNAAREFRAAREQPRDERAGLLRLAVVPEIADAFQAPDPRWAGDEFPNFVSEDFTGPFVGVEN